MNLCWFLLCGLFSLLCLLVPGYWLRRRRRRRIEAGIIKLLDVSIYIGQNALNSRDKHEIKNAVAARTVIIGLIAQLKKELR